MIPTPNRTAEAVIDCGTCRACCHQVVVLGDDESGYDAETISTPAGTIRLLRRHPDGSCIYLTAAGCSIYADRPACCRVFDCGAWFRGAPPKVRKALLRDGGQQEKRMWREGRRRANA